MSVTNCPSCQYPVVAGSIFCDNCGYDLRNAAVTPQPPGQPAMPVSGVPVAAGGGIACPSCGYQNVQGSMFCENCGVSLSQQTPQPAAAPSYAPPQPSYQAGGITCSSCGFANVQGASFCENCGAPLGGQPIPAVGQGGVLPSPPVPIPSVSYVTGRLVVQGTNVTIDIPAGKNEITIGREDPVSGIFPEINLDPYGGQDSGVSRNHAKLIVQSGQLALICKDTPNGTFLNKQRLSPNNPYPVNNGDEIRLGKLAVNYYSS